MTRSLSLAVAACLFLLVACGSPGGSTGSPGQIVTGADGGSCCPAPWIEQNGACCPACVLQGCMAPCYLYPGCPPPPPPDGGTADGGIGSCSPGFFPDGCSCCPPCVKYGCMLPCEVIPGCG
jgi:hypothetical protein